MTDREMDARRIIEVPRCCAWPDITATITTVSDLRAETTCSDQTPVSMRWRCRQCGRSGHERIRSPVGATESFGVDRW